MTISLIISFFLIWIVKVIYSTKCYTNETEVEECLFGCVKFFSIQSANYQTIEREFKKKQPKIIHHHQQVKKALQSDDDDNEDNLYRKKREHLFHSSHSEKKLRLQFDYQRYSLVNVINKLILRAYYHRNEVISKNWKYYPIPSSIISKPISLCSPFVYEKENRTDCIIDYPSIDEYVMFQLDEKSNEYIIRMNCTCNWDLCNFPNVTHIFQPTTFDWVRDYKKKVSDEHLKKNARGGEKKNKRKINLTNIIFIFLSFLLTFAAFVFYYRREVVKRSRQIMSRSFSWKFGKNSNNQNKLIAKEDLHMIGSVPELSDILTQGNFGTIHAVKDRSELVVKEFENKNLKNFDVEVFTYLTIETFKPNIEQSHIASYQGFIRNISPNHNNNDNDNNDNNNNGDENVSGLLLEDKHWLILKRYDEGNLKEYLMKTTLSYDELIRFSQGIADGLKFLHDDTNCGIIIVHRDIKPKNILLTYLPFTKSLSVIITDFDLAIVTKTSEICETSLIPKSTYSSKTQITTLDQISIDPFMMTNSYYEDLWKTYCSEHSTNLSIRFEQVGTFRYMAPEILDGAISFNVNAYGRIDTYSAGLILWEMLNRCHDKSEKKCDEYTPPYKELSANCTIIDFQRHVSQTNRRPSILKEWYKDENFFQFIRIIEESWDNDSEARLSSPMMSSRLQRLSINL
ncbi:hypothetical protein SNEBB_009609 [Seison nebaliae]|nr:hypothetical protein SNEBB_009609 [Seison nebaliae]